ncbi:MAG: hypothetical protein JNJ61_22390, partial [Anaerolineae bacterium]|nr:hypothetical protein [Anaerolineae bacterium]
MRQKNILTIGYSSPSVEEVVRALRNVSSIQFDFCHVPGLNDARQVLQDNHWDLILYDATAPDLHPFEIIHLTQT